MSTKTHTAKAIDKAHKRAARACTLTPCVIATVTPLTVTINGGTITGQRVLGATYTVGAHAVALQRQPASPIILPIGN